MKLTLLLLTLLAVELPWSEAPVVRPDVTTGFGPVIDDLESRVAADHPMRNESDPGNWAHELTHYLQNDLRNRTRANDNCFYVGYGSYLRLPEPRFKLKLVADEVPQHERGEAYQTYFVSQLSQFPDSPLYVLDEACAFAMGVEYGRVAGKKDTYREARLLEFNAYCRALVRAVKKHDPQYQALPYLEAFVEWHLRRVDTLLDVTVIVPPAPPRTPVFPPLYEGRYHTRNRVRNFFKR